MGQVIIADMTLHSRISYAGLAVIVTAVLVSAAPPQVPAPTQHRKTVQVMPEPDKSKEDDVAKLFEAIRAEAKLPRLRRIKHRAQLEQDICTSALTGVRPKISSAFYTTANPQSATLELRTIASSNPVDQYHPGRPVNERYSVAVWKTRTSQTENADYYWVGIGTYGSAVGEFVDCHFTDDVHYCGKWKESIARSCRGK